MKCVKFTHEKNHIKDFIKLYHKLYHKRENMQNDIELKQILTNSHVLSKYFLLHKFCIYEGKKIVGRFAITVYEGDDKGYFGFFECINDLKVARFLFDNASKYAKSMGLVKLVGPVDASFWLKYRLKINKFDRSPYTGEPFNKNYYHKLFCDNGFEVCEHYTSSVYNALENDFDNEKYSSRYHQFLGKGYEIKSPTFDEWDDVISVIYDLISRLYSDFPIYKQLSREDFCKHFDSYKLIVNFDMVKMAYYEDKAVGFFISIPNFSNAVFHTKNILNLFKILKIRKSPKEYVMLYMGVDYEHKGLGKAIVQAILDELKRNNLPSIGALQRDGKVTQKYVEEKIDSNMSMFFWKERFKCVCVIS